MLGASVEVEPGHFTAWQAQWWHCFAKVEPLGIWRSGGHTWADGVEQLEIAINFIPPVGTTQTLACLIGRPKAIKFLYDGKILSAIKALDIGLVDKLHPAEELRSYVQSYAESLASNPTKVLAAIRRCITLGGGMPFEKSLDYEIEQAAALTDTPDFIEGVKTFLEKN